MKKIAILAHVPLWISHHAEALEIALREANQSFVTIYTCKGSIVGCPANPNQSYSLCSLCRLTSRKSEKLLKNKNIQFKKIDLYSAKANPFKLSFSNISDLYKFEYKNYPIGRLVYSTLVSELNDCFFDIKINQQRINSLVTNGVGIFNYFEKEILNNRIDKLYVWNGRRSSEGSALHAAKNNNIEYSTFISGASYNSILIRDNCETINDVGEASADMKKISRELEIPTRRASLIKHGIEYLYRNQAGDTKLAMNYLGFYKFHENFSVTKDISEKLIKRRFVVLFTGTYFEFAGIPGFDTRDLFFKNFYDAVKLLNDGKLLQEEMLLVIRWHPNSIKAKGVEKETIKDLIDKSAKNVIHIPPESNMDSYWLIENSEKVISIGSSIAMEAAIRGKATAFLGHNLFEELQCFTKINSFNDLKSFLISGKVSSRYFYDSIAWGVFFSSFGNFSFQKIFQKTPGNFYFNGSNIVPKIFIILKKMRKIILKVLNINRGLWMRSKQKLNYLIYRNEHTLDG